MTIAAALTSTLGIVEAAGRVVSKIPVKDAAQAGGRFLANSMTAGGAITQLSRQTTILSREFVDEAIIDEPILANLNKSLHGWYTAQVICALSLGQVVAGKRTVQDVMTVVQTGHNAHPINGKAMGYMWNKVGARAIGQESFLENYLGSEADGCSFGMEDIYGPMTRAQMAAHKQEQFKRDRVEGGDFSVKSSDTPQDKSVQVRSVASSEHSLGPLGELYELKIANPDGNGQATVVPVFIQMQPTIVPAAVAPRFIDMNVAPTLWQRWVQMRAGELTFWRDFLLSRDLHRRMKSTIKDPVTASTFSDFLRTVAKKDAYAIGDATDRLGARQSANLANSVMIFSEETVTQAKMDSGIDLHNPKDRARYFRDTYTMIIAIIDPLHQRVTVYFNGTESEINAPYSEFRPKDTKFDPKDFMVALQAFSTNNISRMR